MQQLDFKDRSPTAERYFVNARQALLSQTRNEATQLVQRVASSSPGDTAAADPNAHWSRKVSSPTAKHHVDALPAYTTLSSAPVSVTTAGPHYFCAGCAELRTEVDQLKDVVARLEATVGKLAFSIRENAARTSRSQSPVPRQHPYTGSASYPVHNGTYDSSIHGDASPSTPHVYHGQASQRSPVQPPQQQRQDPPADPFEAELQRSNDLRNRAQLRPTSPGDQFTPTSPILRDQQASLAIKAELRVFEKRMVTSMTKLANRLAQAEADAANAIEISQAMHGDLATAIADLRAEKVSKTELKPLVLPIVDTARDITGERVANLYRLFGWPEARVQQAVASGDQDRVTDTIFASPSLGRLVDGLVKNAEDISTLRDEVHHLHHVRMTSGPALGAKQRLLGMEIADEMDLKGVRVTQVFAGGPGHLAGFKVGDVITMVNHVHVTSRNDFLKVMSGVMPNTIVRLHRYRARSTTQIPEEVEVVAAGETSRMTGAAI